MQSELKLVDKINGFLNTINNETSKSNEKFDKEYRLLSGIESIKEIENTNLFKFFL